VITKDLGLSNLEFGTIATWFLLAYTVSQALSGRLYDRIGTRLGFTASVTVWSLAAMATATARSFFSLSAAKAVAEWFPVRERAFGMAIFNSGAALGAVVAPPLLSIYRVAPAAAGQAPAIRTEGLLHHRQVWGIVLARFITDPTWWLYITWLPKYLNDARGDRWPGWAGWGRGSAA